MKTRNVGAVLLALLALVNTAGDLRAQNGTVRARDGVFSNSVKVATKDVVTKNADGSIELNATCPEGAPAGSVCADGKVYAGGEEVGTGTAAAVGDVDFTIAFLPDPHLPFAGGEASWAAQAAWVIANQSAWNIQAVLCAGDHSNTGLTADLAAAWTSGWSAIDAAGIRWLTAAGNHDYAGNAPAARDTTGFDAQVGHSRISGKSWYGGYYDVAGSKANQYITFEVGSRRFLVMALELFPRAAVVAWAQTIIEANPTREVLVLTHAYQRYNGARFVDGDLYGPSTYSLSHAGSPPANYDAADLWAVLRTYRHVRIILSGHDIGGAAGQHHFRWTGVGTAGNYIHQIWGNYQDASPVTQTAVLLRFRTSRGTVEVTQVNTTTGAYDETHWPTYSIPVEPLFVPSAATLQQPPWPPSTTVTTKLPALCAEGVETVIVSDASAGNQIRICNSTGTGWNTASLVQSGSVTDAFERADGPPGGDWLVDSGTWVIASGQLTQTQSFNSAVWQSYLIVWAGQPPPTPDYNVEAIITKDATDQRTVSLVARATVVTGNISLYSGSIRNVSAGNDQWQIYKFTSSGNWVQLGSTTSEEFTNGTRVRFSVMGAALKLQAWDGSTWVNKVEVTDNSITGTGVPGIRINHNDGAKVDNFIVSW
jgi:hypothetical protein